MQNWKDAFDLEYSGRDLSSGYLPTWLRKELKEWIEGNVIAQQEDTWQQLWQMFSDFYFDIEKMSTKEQFLEKAQRTFTLTRKGLQL